MTSQGIDVSEWQGPAIDWPKVHGAGVDFAIVRAAYGLTHADPDFARNWREAKAAGVARGAYIWLRASQSGRDQADYFAGLLAGDHGELAPWVDVENADRQPAGVVLDQLGRFADELTVQIGTRPTIYTGPAFWRSLGIGTRRFAGFAVAIAHYGVTHPDVPPPFTHYAYWQHTSAGHVAGIPGRVDLDLSTVAAITAAGNDPKGHPYVNLNAPIVAIVDHPSGQGYWQIGADGGIFGYGKVPDLAKDNPLPSMKLNGPITGAAVTPTGNGLWLTGADGGLFRFGDAPDFGSANR